jgi:hypothetical protein
MGGARRAEAGRHAIQIRRGPELIEKVARASERQPPAGGGVDWWKKVLYPTVCYHSFLKLT